MAYLLNIPTLLLKREKKAHWPRSPVGQRKGNQLLNIYKHRKQVLAAVLWMEILLLLPSQRSLSFAIKQ